jgi:serine/threonine protein kinase
VDVWSLGVMVMEMLEKDPPYMGQPPTRVLFNILKKGLPDLKVLFFFLIPFFKINFCLSFDGIYVKFLFSKFQSHRNLNDGQLN